MGEIFLTSDTHFAHIASFLWEPRGFKSVEEMDEAIIERWNKVVKPNDIVYHLGDVMLSDNKKGIECFNRLNGEIFVIWGNHETDTRKNLLAAECPNFRGGWYAYLIKHNKMNIYLSHYPTMTANYDEDNKHFSQHVISLHGHLHTKEKWNFDSPFVYNVAMDAHNCMPIHIDEVMTDIRQKWNEVKGE